MTGRVRLRLKIWRDSKWLCNSTGTARHNHWILGIPFCVPFDRDLGMSGSARASKSSKRRRRSSMDVVDAKEAVDLATAQTYSENVFLFVPNLIGKLKQSFVWGMRHLNCFYWCQVIHGSFWLDCRCISWASIPSTALLRTSYHVCSMPWTGKLLEHWVKHRNLELF